MATNTDPLLKDAAGYFAELHRQQCLKVYTLIERREDAEKEQQFRLECVQAQLTRKLET